MANKKHDFEFFGPHGPALIMVFLPLTLYGLVYACNANGTLQLSPTFSLPGFSANQKYFTLEALAAYVAWFFLILGLHLVLPGASVKGVKLPNDKQLTYKLNSFYVFLLAYGGAIYFSFGTGQLNLGWVYDNFVPLITASVIFSTALSFYLYFSSFGRGKLLCDHGNTGYPIYDFWMGRELNPRIGSLDLKEFCELYPGLIGWLLVNLAMAYKQYGALGYVTNSMLLVNGFAAFYVIDALWNESAILTTMDITTDGFGFMLAFGDLAWVPFTYTIQARFLVDYPQNLPLAGVALVLGVQILGYTIFRGANGQKDQFRRDPNHPSVKHLKTLPTKRGTKLIISGWWGVARHINYFGDWLMGVAWCMPTGIPGLQAIVPFFYAIYFAVLLIHRDRRDDAACRVKYGADWDKYCSIVKSRIVPFIY